MVEDAPVLTVAVLPLALMAPCEPKGELLFDELNWFALIPVPLPLPALLPLAEL
jgi:hypothetical protein